jgi:hypothetical protein
MASFLYKSQHTLTEIQFKVKKLRMIIIGEPVDKPEREIEYIEMNRCDVAEAPVSDTPYPLDNRKMFLQFIRQSVKDYKPRKNITCDSMKDAFELLPHQRLVSQYLKIDTPYRGLLLYHGLGSGKTCSAIAIAETLKPYKNIVVMTPKSLQMNFVQELKKCGDPLYMIHQKWEWVSPTKEQIAKRCLDGPVRRNGKMGLWVDGSGTDYAALNVEDQQSVQDQIDKMIRAKYNFIVYNTNNLRQYIPPGKNPFSNNVVIVDEAHNFVSRIVNALSKDPTLPACEMYRLMMEATNCKVIFLSGTPMINYPHEISVMFNMLRGYMTTWSCKSTISEELIREKFPEADIIYRTTGDTVHITHSPQGFVRANPSNPDVVYTNYDTPTFEDRLTNFFKDTKLTKKQFTAFPDNRDEFNELFVQNGKLKNKIKLECRLLGLASYFPDLSSLMPRLITPIQIHRVAMSKQQFDEYTAARSDELRSEKKTKKSNELKGNYRAASRQLSNTTYPIEARKLRPTTNVKKEGPEEGTEDEVVNKSTEAFYNAVDKSDYCTHIELYSPKFDLMVKNIQKHSGLQLVYSQFITIEGLRSFSRVLDSRGFAGLVLEQGPNGWTIRMPDKPSRMYIVYSADKEDKKEIYRNIFNKNWDALPQHIREQASTMDISVFMITSAGSEGISLKNVQYVHIMEPYWNPVRTDQVIGRARRICSHNTLDEKDRFVEVNLYLSVLPDIDLPEIIKDDLVGDKPGTTDEYLYNLSQKKRNLSEEILSCIRRASIDCSLFGEDCLNLNTNDPNSISYHPDIDRDLTSDKEVALNRVTNIQNIKYRDTKLYYVEKLENDRYTLYRDKTMSAPIGYMSSDRKKLYNKQKEPIPFSKIAEL